MYKEPYFFKNKEWYERYLEDGIPCVRLTDAAPKEAIDSYNEYFKSKEVLINFEVKK